MLTERCITEFNSGPPIVSGGYNQNVQFFQTADHTVLHHEQALTLRDSHHAEDQIVSRGIGGVGRRPSTFLARRWGPFTIIHTERLLADGVRPANR